MPLPKFPAVSVMPVKSRTIELVAKSTLAAVKVAVQVIPPSAELTAVKVPLGMVRSSLVKPVTASEKVMVTVAVSPE